MPRLLSALRRQPVDRPPVWIMRQAGRFLPEYRATREQAGSFVELCRSPRLAAEVTLQPIRRFGLDGAIIFSDILLPLAPLGVHFEFTDGGGPHLAQPLDDPRSWQRLSPPPAWAGTEFVAEALGLVRSSLPEEVAVIGFCGAPWTLACYLVEGRTSRDHAATKAALYAHPAEFRALLDALADAMAAYLGQQVAAGAQAVQVFDSWAGTLSAADYRRHVVPALARLLNAVPTVPRIVYVGGGGHLTPVLAPLACEAVSVDWRCPLAVAAASLPGKAIQGNLDPAVLLSSPGAIRSATAAMLDAAPTVGYVANLGHGILPATPVENVEAFLDVIRGRT
jgi:uroporphyrinogen decarboxylase